MIVKTIVVKRVARCGHMNIITLAPSIAQRKIPVYSKGVENRNEMLRNYYKYCDITTSYINETEL